MMSIIRVSILAALVTVVSATPVSLTPSRAVRRANPVPSTYPLGDACGNEWKYLNFDPDNGSDKSHLGTLHNLICSGEVRAYIGWGLDSADKANEVYKDFFADDDETKENVASVLGLLQGPDEDGKMIGDPVAGMVLDNLDFGSIGDTGSTCEGGDTWGYTDTDPLDGLEKIHFCDPTWGMPEGFDASTCDSQGDRPTEMIDAITRIAIHEMTHYSTVGPASTLGEQIVDQLNEDGNVAYGINRAYGLNDDGEDNQPAKAESNADNYAYMAQLAWVSYVCSGGDQDTYDTFFPLSPDGYED